MSRQQANEPVSERVSDEQLSALLDGELDDHGVVRACAAWRQQGDVREIWHTYHLIGDVLRSEDLASTARRDAVFLQGLRARLAEEPAVLAPARRAGRSPLRRWGWRGPVAVAAGFVAVAGVLVVTRMPAPPKDVEVAAVPPPAAPAAAVKVTTPTSLAAPNQGIVRAAEPPAATALATEPVVNNRLIRDARLDRYLAAHQQFAGTSALGVPSAFLRGATTDASNR